MMEEAMEEEEEGEARVAERVVAGEVRGGEMHYLVQWHYKGDVPSEATWVPASRLSEAAGAAELAADFEESINEELREMEGGEEEEEDEEEDEDEDEGGARPEASEGGEYEGGAAEEGAPPKRQRYA